MIEGAMWFQFGDPVVRRCLIPEPDLARTTGSRGLRGQPHERDRQTRHDARPHDRRVVTRSPRAHPADHVNVLRHYRGRDGA